jgi:hypothetical protein
VLLLLLLWWWWWCGIGFGCDSTYYLVFRLIAGGVACYFLRLSTVPDSIPAFYTLFETDHIQ